MQKYEFDELLRRAEVFCSRLEDWLFADTVNLQAEYCMSKEPVPIAERAQGQFRPIVSGEKWGNAWDSAWFHLKGEVPQEWAGKKIAMRLFLSGEILLCSADGEPICGLTNHSVFGHNYSKELYFFPEVAKGGEKIEFWAEAAANALAGIPLNSNLERGNQPDYYDTTVRSMYIGVYNEEVSQLRYDVLALIALVNTLGDQRHPAMKIVRTISDAINIYSGSVENATAARQELRKYYDLPLSGNTLTAVAVGHAHIDTGWLWPVRESVRKCGRTFSSQLMLMERYPDYVFGASQAQHYAFTKDHYPEVYARIKEKVKSGQWEIQGGMWVEADANLAGGEAFVRQFIHGKNFFMDEFGLDVKNLWLPDVFGYSASLPQIIRKSGCDFFVTQKMSWNKVNVFPHNTFKWRGIDGSEVITHFPPENNYNSELSPARLNPAVQRYVENDFIPEFLSLFGIGNGGGGPCETHIENGKRLESLEGCPRVKFGRADAFLEGLRRYEGRLKVWEGELYLEMHRGTLTSQAAVKKGNRMLEQTLRKVEAIYSCLPWGQYPAAELDRIWKILLINQFHDILPGSSIKKVYEVTRAEHAACLADCADLIAAAGAKALQDAPDKVTYFNPLSHGYDRATALPEGWTGVAEMASQQECGGAVVQLKIPALSSVTLTRGQGAAVDKVDGLVLENELIRYEFAANGKLLKAYDKEAARNAVIDGNDFTIYDDRPNIYDAWDVDDFYMETPVGKASAVSAVKFAGPVRQGLCMELKISRSVIKQKITLEEGSKRLDFATEVDWREDHRMLRVAFPVQAKITESVSDIQYGYLRRPTHSNTQWDMAKFESVVHRYSDMSDLDYGVALMNDCKYGYKLKENVLDLNLLRSPRYPDDSADVGVHTFTYSLLPHCGILVESDVMAQSAMLNLPPACWAGKSGSLEAPCRINGNGVSLEVLKKAEKSDNLIIRLVETLGRDSEAELVFNNDVKIVETDLIEWNEVGDAVSGKNIPVKLKAFEIRTYKVQ